MPAVNRMEFLVQAGKLAWKGLVTAVRGVDVVIDPNAPPDPPDPAVAEGATPAPEAEPTPPLPDQIGTPIGRHALASSQHRVGGAVLAPLGADGAPADPWEGVPPTLGFFPGTAPALVKAALGLEGEELSLEGDLDLRATRHDMAWLPLGTGVGFYAQTGTARLVAVGGYRRAALVRFGEAGPGTDVWCSLGDDGLFEYLPAEWRSQLLLERPEALAQAIARKKVRLALLGGEALEHALGLPGAAVQWELVPHAGLPCVPVWGLFSSGRGPAVTRFEQAHMVMVPVSELAGLEDLAEAMA